MSSDDVSEWVEQWDHPDAPRRDEEDRYAIYAIHRMFHPEQVRVCETSETGVVAAIKQMILEGEIKRGERVGIFDRLTRQFIVNPYA